MSDEAFESVLESVDPARRSFLRSLLAGAGALAALAVPASRVLADEPVPQNAQKKKKKKKKKGDRTDRS